MPYDRNTMRNIDQAYEEAKAGALDGSLRWGVAGLVVFGIAQFTWPLYRNLTIPFKSFLQTSTMITGGMVNADSRMQQAEKKIRIEQQSARRQAFEDEIDRSCENGFSPDTSTTGHEDLEADFIDENMERRAAQRKAAAAKKAES